jgi:micrococcal nuclease
MRILRPVFSIAVLGLAVFALYQFLILPVFFPKAKLIHMIDPDSLLVKENGKLKVVQLIGADAPELTGRLKGRQCGDYMALSGAAAYFKTGRVISLAGDGKAGEKDIYGRELRYVYLPDGALYNEKLLQDGFARQSNPGNADYKHKTDFLKAQEEAKAKGTGIWDPKGCNGRF